MKIIKVTLIIVITVACVSMVIAIIGRGVKEKQNLQPLDQFKLESAIQRYSQKQLEDKKVIPQSVTMQKLVDEGFLSTADVKSWNGNKVEVYLNVDETMPQSILVDAILSDGSHHVMLQDGSVQQFSDKDIQKLKSSNK